jgi:hypothetical protein
MGLVEDGWIRRATLTIPAASVGTGGVTGYSFPLSTDMLSANVQADMLTNAKSDLSDIRVSTDEDGETLLTADLIYATKTGGSAIGLFARVGTTSLSASTANVFYLWWGNASASAQTGTNAYDADWESYLPNGGVGVNRITGTTYGTAIGGLTSGGEVGPFGVDTLATDYNGTNQGIDLGTTPASITGSQERTALAWVNPGVTSVSRNLWLALGDGAANSLWAVQVTEFSGRKLTISVGTNLRRATFGPAADEWSLVSVSLGGGTQLSDHRFQLNTSLEDATSGGGTIATRVGGDFTFGTSSGTSYWLGLVSENQIHSTERSDAWRLTENEAGQDAAGWASTGDAEDVEPVSDGSARNGYRKVRSRVRLRRYHP